MGPQFPFCYIAKLDRFALRFGFLEPGTGPGGNDGGFVVVFGGHEEGANGSVNDDHQGGDGEERRR